MSRVQSFPPLAAADARVLVLGSMPGSASLKISQYYAHPRNAFWPIMEALFDIPRDLAYEVRCAALLERRVAVWDVLKTCARASSLDADIDSSSIVPNDFAQFFDRHPDVGSIFFNGSMAEQIFRRRVVALLPPELAALDMFRLPSTSPANASYTWERKLAAWRAIAR